MIVLGIDIGTTGTKVIAIDELGKIVGYGYQGYGLITLCEGWVEQDPLVWYDSAASAVRQAIQNCDKYQVAALSLSTQGASSFLASADFQPLTNAITWLDKRSSKQMEDLSSILGEEYIYRTTGWKPHPSLDMAKFRWIIENNHDLYVKAAYFMSTIDYMNCRLVGQNVIDPTNAAIRQLMNIWTGDWDHPILEAIGADRCKLAQILPSATFLGNLLKKSAEDFGLHEKVRVYNGGHDQYCGLLGAGVSNPGEVLLSTGTAWAVTAVTNHPIYSKSRVAFGPHIINGKFGAMAALPISGLALEWIKDIIGSDYNNIDQNSIGRMKKDADLMFYPYLSGAAFPLWNVRAKASFTGLGLEHDQYDLALATMEGVAFQARMALDEFLANDISIATVYMIGGATHSPIWTKIIAALCDCDLYLMENSDSACIGAASIAAVAEGLFGDYQQCSRSINKATRVKTDDLKEFKAHYMHKYHEYQRTWSVLKQLYESK